MINFALSLFSRYVPFTSFDLGSQLEVQVAR